MSEAHQSLEHFTTQSHASVLHCPLPLLPWEPRQRGGARTSWGWSLGCSRIKGWPWSGESSQAGQGKERAMCIPPFSEASCFMEENISQISRVNEVGPLLYFSSYEVSSLARINALWDTLIVNKTFCKSTNGSWGRETFVQDRQIHFCLISVFWTHLL